MDLHRLDIEPHEALEIARQKVGIEQHDPFSGVRHCHREVDGNIGLTNATLAAGDRYCFYRVGLCHTS